MPQYVVTGKNSSGEGVVSVNIEAINQDTPVVQDIDVIDAIRTQLAGTPGIVAVVAQKFEQVVTTI
jgi:hypothetical protein